MEETELAPLRKEIGEYLFQYLKEGAIPENRIIGQLLPEEADIPKDKINSFDQVIDIHFLMQDEVTEFIDQLEYRLRTIKTETKSRKITNKGEIDGKVDWESTIKKRYSENPKDNSLFVINDKKENHDIDRNILLKYYLQELIRVFNNVRPIIEDKSWAERKWGLNDGQSKIQALRNITKDNVHLERIREVKDYEPTERMIEKAEKSRREIYREAARGIKQREKYRQGRELDQLLGTIIQPDEDTILELGLIFTTIDYLLSLNDEYELEPIKDDSSTHLPIARIDLTENKEIHIYHDKTSPSTRFRSYDPEEAGKRQKASRSQYRQIIKEYLDVNSRDASKRPDMVVELRQDGELVDLLLGEVKNRSSEEGIKDGVSDLMDYLAYAENSDSDNWIFNVDQEKFGTGVNGILFTRSLENVEDKELGPEHPLEVVQFDEKDFRRWKSRIQMQVERWLIRNLE
jgi:hypothetical protein